VVANQVRLETRSLTSARSQNSRNGKFASFLFRLRNKQDDGPDLYDDNGSLYSHNNNLVGNHIETAQDCDYDDEITLGSGFENMSLADSLDDSSVCSENTFHSNLDAAHQRAAAAQQQQQQQELPELRPDEDTPPQAPSFLQRMLSKSSATSPATNEHEIIRKALGVAAAATMTATTNKDKNYISLNSTLSETDSDENPAESDNENDAHDDDNVDGVESPMKEQPINESSTNKSNSSSSTSGSLKVGRGKSLMQGSMMAKTRSVQSLNEPCVSDILEQSQTATLTTTRRASRTEQDGLLRPLVVPLEKQQSSTSNNNSNNDDDDDAPKKNADSTTTSSNNRWDSDASVTSDTPLPKRPRRRTTDSESSGDNDDDTDYDESDAEQDQQEKEETKQQQEFRIHSQLHLNSPRQQQQQQHKPLASQSMRNLKASEEEVDDESILSLLAGLLASWAVEREAAAEEEATVVEDFGGDSDNHKSDDEDDQYREGNANTNPSVKGILKTSITRLSSLSSSLQQMNSESKDDDGDEGEKVDDAEPRLSVTFDNVEIREYERVVGDNPSCTRGPPVAIGWTYQIGNLCPLDDYETMIRGPRRSKREFHLTAEQRTQLLVSEWECSEEDIRRARREATYIQYCRAKTSFSGSRVAAKEAAFLRKANERSKMQVQQQHQQATIIMSGSMPSDPPFAPTSPNRATRSFQRTAQSPSSRGNRAYRPNSSSSNNNNINSNGRSPQPVHSGPKPARKAPPPLYSPSRSRRTGNNNNSSNSNPYAFPKAAPISPSNTPKAPPSLAPLSTAAAAPELPPTRALLEV